MFPLLLLMGADLTVLVTHDDLTSTDSAALHQTLESELRARGHQPSTVFARGCADLGRCIREASEETGAPRVMLFEAYAGPTRIRVVASLVTALSPKVTRDLERDTDWRIGIRAVTDEMARYLPSPAPVPSVTVEGPAMERPKAPVVTFVLGAASIAALGTGLGFGISSQNAVDDLRSGGTLGSQIPMRAKTAEDHATIANVAFVVAGAALVGVIVAVVLEH